MLQVPDGARCFIDVNILYSLFAALPAVSEHSIRLMERVVARRVAAFVSAHVLVDVAHKVLLAEAMTVSGRPRAGLVPWLRTIPKRCGSFDGIETR